MKKKFFKKWKKWKRYLLKYLEKKICRKLQDISQFYASPTKSSMKKMKNEMKNACDGVATALEFILELSHSFASTH